MAALPSRQPGSPAVFPFEAALPPVEQRNDYTRLTQIIVFTWDETCGRLEAGANDATGVHGPASQGTGRALLRLAGFDKIKIFPPSTPRHRCAT